MADPHLRWSVAAARRHALVEPPGNHCEPVHPPFAFERGKVTLSDSLPCHRPAARIGALAHGLPPRVAGQQCRDLATNGGGIAGPRPNAAALVQQMTCPP